MGTTIIKSTKLSVKKVYMVSFRKIFFSVFVSIWKQQLMY